MLPHASKELTIPLIKGGLINFILINRRLHGDKLFFLCRSVSATGVFPVIKSGKRLFYFFDAEFTFMSSNRTSKNISVFELALNGFCCTGYKG
jgi:hypothetical protein